MTWWLFLFILMGLIKGLATLVLFGIVPILLPWIGYYLVSSLIVSAWILAFIVTRRKAKV